MFRYLFIIFLLNCSNLFGFDFSSVDSIINSSIQKKYFPGAQLLIGSGENLIYFKSFGHFTYDASSKNVDSNSIFDLASLTKVLATTPSIMVLFEQGKIDLNDKVIKYIPEFDNNGKDIITVKNLLLHNSGLIDWLPFYKTCKSKEDILKEIFNIELTYRPESKYLYSDLNFILLGLIIERISGTNLKDFCDSNIYYKLKLTSTFFQPPEDVISDVLPTEYDNYFRNKLMMGEVHDEAAYISGGVSGHAGLFSNCYDIFKIMKIFFPAENLSGSGTFFRKETIKLFTTKENIENYNNTRALGWDTKPEPNSYPRQCGDLISENCFGHTGFTGTSVWYDIDKKICIILLTNRIYPDRNNNGIKKIRPLVYDEAIKILSNNKN
jgi:beta-N-acetylhexosaminidase